MSEKIKLGQHGERIAARYLRLRLYRVLARNYRTPFGEIDLVCRRSGVLVFVEVKTRTSQHFGNPETAITMQKMSHLIKAAECYRRREQCHGQPWRIDVLAIDVTANSRPAITHFENAVQDWPAEKTVRG